MVISGLMILIYGLHGVICMKKVQFTFWQDDEFFIGFLNDYPDYQTQGMTKEELIENLQDLLTDIRLIATR